MEDSKLEALHQKLSAAKNKRGNRGGLGKGQSLFGGNKETLKDPKMPFIQFVAAGTSFNKHSKFANSDDEGDDAEVDFDETHTKSHLEELEAEKKKKKQAKKDKKEKKKAKKAAKKATKAKAAATAEVVVVKAETEVSTSTTPSKKRKRSSTSDNEDEDKESKDSPVKAIAAVFASEAVSEMAVKALRKKLKSEHSIRLSTDELSERLTKGEFEGFGLNGKLVVLVAVESKKEKKSEKKKKKSKKAKKSK